MNLTQNEQNLLIEKIIDKVSDVEFGRINISLSISDNYLMYFDIKKEDNERTYVHSKAELLEDEK